MDSINRATWSNPATVRWFESFEGYTDPGERAALESVAAAARDGAILDLGVGAGRTVPLLRAISQRYTAIDYTPALVAACKELHPGVEVSLGDARDLSRFPAESFRLVVFSYNGIDAVDVTDRALILAEVARVLEKGGMFVFSSHNQDGPGHGEKLSLDVNMSKNPLKLALRFARSVSHLGEKLQNRAHNSRLNEVHDGYSIMNPAAHDHGLLVYYTALWKQLEDLQRAGFQPDPLVFGNLNGLPLQPGADTRDIWWFHFVARR